MADSRFSSSGSGSTSTTLTDTQGTSSVCELHSMSLLERLRTPSASELGRKRKIDANSPPPKGKKRSTQNMRKNLAKASALASSSDGSMDVLEWWKNNSVELPYWSQAAQWIFLVQASSAAAERVFSILNLIGDTQAN